MKSYRQGDVLLVAIENIPDSAKLTTEANAAVILAYGESTGHSHSIRAGATLFRPDDMPAGPGGFLEVGATGAVLEHQEHGSVFLPKGLYKQAVQVEETPEVINVVAD